MYEIIVERKYVWRKFNILCLRGEKFPTQININQLGKFCTEKIYVVKFNITCLRGKNIIFIPGRELFNLKLVKEISFGLFAFYLMRG